MGSYIFHCVLWKITWIFYMYLLNKNTNKYPNVFFTFTLASLCPILYLSLKLFLEPSLTPSIAASIFQIKIISFRSCLTPLIMIERKSKLINFATTCLMGVSRCSSWIVASQKICPRSYPQKLWILPYSKRVNITLYGKDVMKDLVKRLSWIILMGLKFNQRYP